jgi:hypothetical protein
MNCIVFVLPFLPAGSIQALPEIPRSAQTEQRLMHPCTGSRLIYRLSSGSLLESSARKMPLIRHTRAEITRAALVRSRRSVRIATATRITDAATRMREAW